MMNAPVSLTERILDAFPSGTYALSGLLRLMDIVESTSVPTAAVECRVQPRLLINPEFVDQHAPSAEKLLMLVMHELHHVLLGHTTLFPRATWVQNFVFDAVINGIVCRMFPTQEHISFFTDFYDANAFPACLLRPPRVGRAGYWSPVALRICQPNSVSWQMKCIRHSILTAVPRIQRCLSYCQNC